MASLTFGSVGDILAICGIIVTTVKSLSKTRGSAVEYQDLIKELQGLSQTIYSIRSLLETHPHLKENVRLQELLKNCRDYLGEQFELSRPYREALQSNPTAGSLRQFCRKIRWLSGKEDRATFQGAITACFLSLSAVLIKAGIDVSNEFHNATMERLAQGFNEIRAANTQLSQTHDASRISIDASIKSSETALILRHDRSDKQAALRHAELCEQIKKLKSANAESRDSDGKSLVARASIDDMSKAYLILVFKALITLSDLGLVGLYQFLQLMQIIWSQTTIPWFPAAKCLFFQDAILRPFYIDMDFISYESFTKMIEDNFQNTPGAATIQMGQYIFEDKRQTPLGLEAVWSSELLKGRKVFMRARITANHSVSQQCPSCGQVNKKSPLTSEITCPCGLQYTEVVHTASTQTPIMRKHHRGCSGAIDPLSPRSLSIDALPDIAEVLRYFKRVQRGLHTSDFNLNAISGYEEDSPVLAGAEIIRVYPGMHSHQAQQAALAKQQQQAEIQRQQQQQVKAQQPQQQSAHKPSASKDANEIPANSEFQLDGAVNDTHDNNISTYGGGHSYNNGIGGESFSASNASLWDRAYERLASEDETLLAEYEDLLKTALEEQF